jgi:hypothetical protein
MDIDTLVNEKIEADTDFQATLADLSEEEKEASITAKKSEVLSHEFTSLKQQADAKAKAEELANNYKIRAEKAEAEAKKVGDKKEPTNSNDLSSKDLYALMSEKVPQEDVDEVVRAAKALNLSVPEALKSNIIKSILSEKAEERTTANATQTRGGARGTSKVSGEDMLSTAEKTGEVPETDEGMRALFNARMARKLKN